METYLRSEELEIVLELVNTLNGMDKALTFSVSISDANGEDAGVVVMSNDGYVFAPTMGVVE